MDRFKIRRGPCVGAGGRTAPVGAASVYEPTHLRPYLEVSEMILGDHYCLRGRSDVKVGHNLIHTLVPEVTQSIFECSGLASSALPDRKECGAEIVLSQSHLEIATAACRCSAAHASSNLHAPRPKPPQVFYANSPSQPDIFSESSKARPISSSSLPSCVGCRR